MVSCGGKLIKIILGLFNLIWLIVGAVIIYIGVRLVLLHGDLEEVSDLAKIDFKALSVIILIVGIAIVVISFLGFFGACCQNRVLLFLYSAILVVIIAIEIYGLVVAIRNNTDIEKEISDAVGKAINEINTDRKTAYLLGMFQYKLKCCGWNGFADYKNPLVPKSCCGEKPVSSNEPVNTCLATSAVKIGCKEKIHFDDIMNLFKGSIALSIVVICVEVILIFAACCLSRDISAERRF
ncbi:hypothetical protein RDWZM_000476 [Blomia tropicalis]|uniref:Tetraspanin n=1 Tax=Blomia tropicalis TaxID=40697 RepID=A0A9Q0RPN7_BLOTA|nr:cd63 antigen [Blomia tropicalis]KAJ6221931.1 hypothetical protein RDWZM_000476 [Blomia tropicalis]